VKIAGPLSVSYPHSSRSRIENNSYLCNDIDSHFGTIKKMACVRWNAGLLLRQRLLLTAHAAAGIAEAIDRHGATAPAIDHI
jgi:hypothetical protein